MLSPATYDTRWYLTCVQKLSLVGLSYRTEPKTKKMENRKKLKCKNGYAQKYYPRRHQRQAGTERSDVAACNL